MGLKDNSRFNTSSFKKIKKSYTTQEEMLEKYDLYVQSIEFDEKRREEMRTWRTIQEKIDRAFLVAGGIAQSTNKQPSIIGRAVIGLTRIGII